MYNYHIYIILTITYFCVSSCANIGVLSGGEKDENSPIVTKCFPENFSTNIMPDKIIVDFDEYIQLKNTNTQIFISPMLSPLKVFLKGKQIQIELDEPIYKKNITYSISFGNSISDLNESNELLDFKFVFSTGEKIDSLQLGGVVNDAFTLKPIEKALVMLYEKLDFQLDSLSDNQQPSFITYTDENGEFLFTNIKNSKYNLVALKDEDANYSYDVNEQVGFSSFPVNPNKDTLVFMSFFSSYEPPFFLNHKIQRNGSIAFVFSHDANTFSVCEMNNQGGVVSYSKNNDTLFYWPKHILEDTTFFTIKELLDTVIVHNYNNAQLGKTTIKKLNSFLLKPNDSLSITSIIPIKEIDLNKVSLFADSLEKKITSNLSMSTLQPTFSFKREGVEHNYKLIFLPGALTSIFNTINNDTVKVYFYTNKLSSHGNLSFNVNNKTSKNYFFQLLDMGENVVYENFSEKNKKNIKYLLPGTYKARIIMDSNVNKKWDTGDYFKKLQPEKVLYFHEDVIIRANWDTEYFWNID